MALLPEFFGLTSSQFADEISSHHQGKGKLLAVELYNLIMKRGKGFNASYGKASSFDPSFIEGISSFSTADKLKAFIYNELGLSISLMPIVKVVKSETETTKLLLKTADGYEIESVIIPMQKKKTICISSQVGCRMGCSFCETGRMGLLRNLTVSEIVQQVFIARHILGEEIDNIVFMGMGEPFDNYDAVLQAVSVLNDMQGMAFGLKNITISTSGKASQIRKLAHEVEKPIPNLAVSINAPYDALRSKLMPHNRKEPLDDVLSAVSEYIQIKNREVLFAYVLLRGINDRIEDAHALAGLVQRFQGRVKVNLIPYNPQSHDRFQPPSDDVVDMFAQALRSLSVRVLLRRTKGRDIMAGCGQLGNIELKKKKSERSDSLPILPHENF